jgi:hemerythrin-like domain-containing protein
VSIDSRAPPVRRQRVAKRVSRKKSAGPRAKKAASRSARKKSPARRPAKRSTARPKARSRAAAKSGTATRKTAARAAAPRPRSATRKKPRPAAPAQSAKPSRFASAATAVRGAFATAAAAVTDRLPWGSGELDAITLLEKDHRRFEELLEQGEHTTERAVKGRTELLDTLTAELNQHELVEEQILYPALKSHPEAKDIVLEGYQEHHVADVIVLELHTLAKDDEKWGAKFKVLKESLEHHIQEEEGEMFPAARSIFSREDLQAMGAQMAKLRAGRG